jgi:hypothetical protein
MDPDHEFVGCLERFEAFDPDERDACKIALDGGPSHEGVAGDAEEGSMHVPPSFVPRQACYVPAYCRVGVTATGARRHVTPDQRAVYSAREVEARATRVSDLGWEFLLYDPEDDDRVGMGIMESYSGNFVPEQVAVEGDSCYLTIEMAYDLEFAVEAGKHDAEEIEAKREQAHQRLGYTDGK